MKGTVHSKMLISWKFNDPQAIQDVHEQIWRDLALYHKLTNRSSAMNGCRQNESKQLTAPIHYRWSIGEQVM